ncbi:hypothetical protein [Lewinella sp. IMCC34183]|uniref:hypothetical protein n=1 Tax=Lewinella sp. IMCC34183 TaxID=2248762 RepID=UPI000E26D8BC|nr:hypothetical protein [Lewinella sp. IMCC34183]
MKKIYQLLFLISVLLIISGASLHATTGQESVWTDLLLGGGLLGTFAAFSFFLLFGKEEVAG